MNPEFGQFYFITATHVGRKRWSPRRREWVRTPLKEPVKALYVGKRQVYSGPIKEDSWDGASYFVHMQRTEHNMLLFILDAHKNPVYVSPEDVLPIDTA